MKSTWGWGMSREILAMLTLLTAIMVPWGCSMVSQSSATSSSPTQSLPVANAGADRQISIILPVATELDGSASTGDDLHFLWWQDGGNPEFVTINQETSANAYVFLNIEGTYNFYLIVSNNIGTSTDDVVIVAL